MPPPPILAAATAGDKSKVRSLCEKDPKSIHAIDANGNSPLHIAVKKETAGYVAAVKVLLEFGADPTAENDNGDTALSIAKDKGHAKLLPALEEGAAKAEAAAAAERKAKAEEGTQADTKAIKKRTSRGGRARI